jgi:hypothetical protein
MIHGILAHAGGLDEMAIILFPILVGGGVWVLTRSPGSKKPDMPKVRPTEPAGKKRPVFAPADPKAKRQTFN